MIGLLIMGLILVPLFALMIASVLESPRSFKVASMFTSVFILQIVAIVIGMIILAELLGFIVPQ